MNAKGILCTFGIIVFVAGLLVGLWIYSTQADYCEIKGNSDSKIYHTKYSIYYDYTNADICFDSVIQAENAGYRQPKR